MRAPWTAVECILDGVCLKMFLAIDGLSAVRHLDNQQYPTLAGVYANVLLRDVWL
jgi:hypothetical protein